MTPSYHTHEQYSSNDSRHSRKSFRKSSVYGAQVMCLPLIPGAVVGWKCLASRCLPKTGLPQTCTSRIYDECIRHSEHHEKGSKSLGSLGSLGSSLPKRKLASWWLPWHCDFRARMRLGSLCDVTCQDCF